MLRQVEVIVQIKREISLKCLHFALNINNVSLIKTDWKFVI